MACGRRGACVCVAARPSAPSQGTAALRNRSATPRRAGGANARQAQGRDCAENAEPWLCRGRTVAASWLRRDCRAVATPCSRRAAVPETADAAVAMRTAPLGARLPGPVLAGEAARRPAATRADERTGRRNFTFWGLGGWVRVSFGEGPLSPSRLPRRVRRARLSPSLPPSLPLPPCGWPDSLSLSFSLSSLSLSLSLPPSLPLSLPLSLFHSLSLPLPLPLTIRM